MSMQPPPPPMAPPAPAGTPYAAGPRFAGFWIRVAAYVIDYVLVYAVVYGINVAVKPISCEDAGDGTCVPGTTSISATFWVITIGLPFLYFWLTWAFGGTIGQRVLKLRVVGADNGQPIGLLRSFLRYIGYIVSAAVVFIGLIWVAFDARKQGWHDKIASSLVIHA